MEGSAKVEYNLYPSIYSWWDEIYKNKNLDLRDVEY